MMETINNMNCEQGKIIRAKKRFEFIKVVYRSGTTRATDAELFQQYIKALDNGLISLEAQRKFDGDNLII